MSVPKSSPQELPPRREMIQRNKMKVLELLASAAADLSRIAENKEGRCADETLYRECIRGAEKLREISFRLERRASWATAQLLDFLDREASDYRKQRDVFYATRARTLFQFLGRSIEEFRTLFQERGLKLPIIFEVLHAERGKMTGQ